MKIPQVMFKVFALVLSASLAVSGPAFATPYVAPVDANTAVVQQEVLAAATGMLNIPAELGQVTGTVTGDPSAPAFIHIQSAHGNYEAEKNIEKLLGYIEKNSKIRLMLLEGAADKLQPEIFRIFPKHPDFNRTVTDKLMQEGYLTGPERFLIEGTDTSAAKPAMEGFGIEDLDAYKKDRDAFISVVKKEKSSEKLLSTLRAAIDKRFAAKLNKDLLTLVRQEEALGSGTLAFEAWLKVLGAASKKQLKLDLSDAFYQDQYPFLIRYYRLQAIGTKIDREKAHIEAAAFLKELEKHKVSKDILSSFNTLLGTPEAGLLKTGSGYSILRRLFESAFTKLPNDFSMKAWPAWTLYAQYIILMQELEAKGLHEETDRLKGRIFETLATTPAEKEYLAAARQLTLLRKLFALELTRSEYEELCQSHQVTESPSHQAAKSSRGDVVTLRSGDLPVFQAAMNFYATAIVREQHMFTNALQRMGAEKQDRAVIVTGGFHSEGLKQLAASKGCSYVQITPRITEISKRDHEIYLKSMLGSRDMETSQIVALLGVTPLVQRGKVTGAVSTKVWIHGVGSITQTLTSAAPERKKLDPEFAKSLFGPSAPQIVVMPDMATARAAANRSQPGSTSPTSATPAVTSRRSEARMTRAQDKRSLVEPAVNLSRDTAGRRIFGAMIKMMLFAFFAVFFVRPVPAQSYIGPTEGLGPADVTQTSGKFSLTNLWPEAFQASSQPNAVTVTTLSGHELQAYIDLRASDPTDVAQFGYFGEDPLRAQGGVVINGTNIVLGLKYPNSPSRVTLFAWDGDGNLVYVFLTGVTNTMKYYNIPLSSFVNSVGTNFYWDDVAQIGGSVKKNTLTNFTPANLVFELGRGQYEQPVTAEPFNIATLTSRPASPARIIASGDTNGMVISLTQPSLDVLRSSFYIFGLQLDKAMVGVDSGMLRAGSLSIAPFGTNIIVGVAGHPGDTYNLQGTTNLVNPPGWKPKAENVQAPTNFVFSPRAPGSPRGESYRLETVLSLPYYDLSGAGAMIAVRSSSESLTLSAIAVDETGYWHRFGMPVTTNWMNFRLAANTNALSLGMDLRRVRAMVFSPDASTYSGDALEGATNTFIDVRFGSPLGPVADPLSLIPEHDVPLFMRYLLNYALPGTNGAQAVTGVGNSDSSPTAAKTTADAPTAPLGRNLKTAPITIPMTDLPESKEAPKSRPSVTRETPRSEVRLAEVTADGLFQRDLFNWHPEDVLVNIRIKLDVAKKLVGGIVAPGVAKLQSYVTAFAKALFPQHDQAVVKTPEPVKAETPVLARFIAKSAAAAVTGRFVVGQITGAPEGDDAILGLLKLVTFAQLNPGVKFRLAVTNASLADEKRLKDRLVVLSGLTALPANLQVQAFEDMQDFRRVYGDQFWNTNIRTGPMAFVTDGVDAGAKAVSSLGGRVLRVETMKPRTLELAVAMMGSAVAILNAQFVASAKGFMPMIELDGVQALMAELNSWVAAKAKFLASA